MKIALIRRRFGHSTLQLAPWDSVMKACSLLLVLSLGSACQASLKTSVRTGADAQVDVDTPEPGEEPSAAPRGASSALAGPDTESSSMAEFALLGARHDVSLKSEQPTTCRCLAAAAGAANDPRFAWEGLTPMLDLDSQLVVAFSTDHQGCDAEGSKASASYKGYTKAGSDVIVMVEEAHPGRPSITAAVVPRPLEGGRLLIRPAPATLPFGQSRDSSESLCEITGIPNRSLSAVTEALRADPAAPKIADKQLVLAPNLIGDLNANNEDPPDDTSSENLSEYSPLKRSERDGFYLSILAGGGHTSQDFSVGGADSDGTLTSFPLSFYMLVGGSPMPDLAVGALIGGGAGSNPSVVQPGIGASRDVLPPAWDVEGDTITFTGARLNLLKLGAFVDYYFMSDGNLHGIADLSYVSVSFSNDTGAGEDLTGPGFGLGIGYDFWLGKNWSLGLLAHMTYAALSARTTGFPSTLLYPSLSASVTFH